MLFGRNGICRNGICKVICVLVSLVFLQEQISWTQDGKPVWQEISAAGGPRAQNVLSDINIPYDIGQVDRSSLTQNSDVIINIQDAHASLSAQMSIAGILESLAANYDVRLVAIEGASDGYLNTSLLGTFPDKKIRDDTAGFLMKEGRMSAGEFFAITRDKDDVMLYGVENDSLYKENAELFCSISDQRAGRVANIVKLRRAFTALAEKVYSEDLKILETKSALHEKGEISFSDYWAGVKDIAAKRGITPEGMPNIQKLLGTIDLEKKIDFAKANAERKELIDVLSSKMEKKDLEALVTRSLLFKEEKISQGDFYSYLAGLAERYSVDPAEYTDLIVFTKYIALYQSIDIIALQRDFAAFEDKLRSALYRNDYERSLSFWSRAVNLIEKLYSLEFSNDDFAYVTRYRNELSAHSCAGFIKDTSLKYRAPMPGECDMNAVFDGIDQALDFYKIAEKRNDVMLANTLKRMRAEGKHVAALVTGGYHTTGLTELMRKDKLSYLVIVPKFEAGKERPYVAILTNKKQPYEKLLESGKYELAVKAYFNDADEDRLMTAVIYALAGVANSGGDWRDEAEKWQNLYNAEYERLKGLSPENVNNSLEPGRFAEILGVGAFKGKGQIRIEKWEPGVFVQRIKDGNSSYFLFAQGEGGLLVSPRVLEFAEGQRILIALEGRGKREGATGAKKLSLPKTGKISSRVDKFTSERGPETNMAIAVMKPGDVQVWPSFQADMAKSWGMMRDKAPMHFMYQLEGGDVQDVDDIAPDSKNARKDVWTVQRHLDEFAKAHPDLEVLGYVGNGNILANARLAAYVNGRMYATEAEKELIRAGKSNIYPALVMWKDGHFSVEEVRFTSEERAVRISDGKDITDDISFLNSGIGVLKEGEAYDLAAHCEHDYDVRHYVDFPFIPTGNVPFGVSQFYDNDGRVKKELLVPAINGEPVTLKLQERGAALTFAQIAELDKNLREEKRYAQASSRAEVKYGSYFIDSAEGEITIGLMRGINPHNIAGIDKNGNFVSIVVGGKSNRVGITFLEAQKKLKEMGVKDAVIFDNGADAMMNLDGKFLVPSFQGRDRYLSILVFARPRAPTPPAAPAPEIRELPKAPAPPAAELPSMDSWIREMQEGLIIDPGVKDHAVMLFKTGLPDAMRDGIVRYLEGKGFDVARVRRVDGEIGIGTVLKRWGKGSGIEFAVKDIAKEGIDTSEANAALDANDGDKFYSWFEGVERAHPDAASVKALKYTLEALNRGIEMVILRSRISREQLVKEFGAEDQFKPGEIEDLPFQDIFKKAVVGATHAFKAKPNTLRGKFIAPELKSDGELSELYKRGLELVPKDIIGLIVNGVHCPKKSELAAEINDYLGPAPEVTAPFEAKAPVPAPVPVVTTKGKAEAPVTPVLPEAGEAVKQGTKKGIPTIALPILLAFFVGTVMTACGGSGKGGGSSSTPPVEQPDNQVVYSISMDASSIVVGDGVFSLTFSRQGGAIAFVNLAVPGDNVTVTPADEARYMFYTDIAEDMLIRAASTSAGTSEGLRRSGIRDAFAAEYRVFLPLDVARDIKLGVNYRGPLGDESYGQNFGTTLWYPSGNGFSVHKAGLEEDMAVMKGYRVSCVRTGLVEDGRALLDENSDVTGYNDKFRADVKVLLDTARNNGIRLELYLVDFYIGFPGQMVQGVTLGGRKAIFTDPVKRKLFIDNFLRPFLKAYGKSPAIKAIDLGNELGYLFSYGVDTRPFLEDVISAIRDEAPRLRVTLGLRTDQVTAFSAIIPRLDYVSLHDYDVTPGLDSALAALPAGMSWELGEVAGNTPYREPLETFKNAIIKGAKAIKFWSFNCDDEQTFPGIEARDKAFGEIKAFNTERNTPVPQAAGALAWLKRIIVPSMPYAEYAVKVAPWIEEGLFFAVPLVIGNWLFGLGSFWTVAVMAAARTVFFFLHEGARYKAPLAAYITPLRVAVLGFMISLFPVLAASLSSSLVPHPSSLVISSLVISSLVIAASLVSVLAHLSENILAILAGTSPASLARSPLERKPVSAEVTVPARSIFVWGFMKARELFGTAGPLSKVKRFVDKARPGSVLEIDLKGDLLDNLEVMRELVKCRYEISIGRMPRTDKYLLQIWGEDTAGSMMEGKYAQYIYEGHTIPPARTAEEWKTIFMPAYTDLARSLGQKIQYILSERGITRYVPDPGLIGEVEARYNALRADLAQMTPEGIARQMKDRFGVVLDVRLMDLSTGLNNLPSHPECPIPRFWADHASVTRIKRFLESREVNLRSLGLSQMKELSGSDRSKLMKALAPRIRRYVEVSDFINNNKPPREASRGVARDEYSLRDRLFEMGRKRQVFAHGVECDKGGVSTLLKIILYGRVIGDNSSWGLLDVGSSYMPEINAGSHGPFYVAFNAPETNKWRKSVDHNYYIVPREASKVYLREMIAKAVAENLITADKAASALSKIVTYSEFISSFEKEVGKPPAAPATILPLKELIAPRMGLLEYAVKVAPWVEEGIFFALPLVIGNWLFGLDSIGTIALMAAARTVFFFAHPGARPHAPPTAYRTPLTVAVAGFAISLLPVVAAMSFGGLSTVDSGLFAFTSTLSLTIVSALFHARQNRAELAVKKQEENETLQAFERGLPPPPQGPEDKETALVVSDALVRLISKAEELSVRYGGIEYARDFEEVLLGGSRTIVRDNLVFRAVRSMEKKYSRVFLRSVAESIVSQCGRALDMDPAPDKDVVLTPAAGARPDRISRLFLKRSNIDAILRTVTLLRYLFPYDDKDLKRPGEPGCVEFEMMDGIFISPVSGSFRRHLLYEKDAGGSPVNITAIKIPGDYRGRFVVDRNSIPVVEDIERRFGRGTIMVDPLFTVETTGRFFIYGREVKFGRSTPLCIVAFRQLPGIRIDALSEQDISEIADRAKLTVPEVKHMIAVKILMGVEAAHRSGYVGTHDVFGNTDVRSIFRAYRGEHFQKIGIDPDKLVTQGILMKNPEATGLNMYYFSAFEDKIFKSLKEKPVEFIRKQLMSNGYSRRQTERVIGILKNKTERTLTDMHAANFEIFVENGELKVLSVGDVEAFRKTNDEILKRVGGYEKASIRMQMAEEYKIAFSDDEYKAIEQQANQELDRLAETAPATILPIKELVAPKMPLAEYAIKVAPWVEEGLFFALPMIASSLVFGLGSFWTVAVMAAARAVFFFLHEGARPNAPPDKYITPLRVAVLGFMISLFPVLAASLSSSLVPHPSSFVIASLVIASTIIASTIISALTHTRENITALATGKAPAVIGGEHKSSSNLPISELPFYHEWVDMMDGKKPVPAAISKDAMEVLEATSEGRDFVQNYEKIMLGMKFLIDDMKPKDVKKAVSFAKQLVILVGADKWRLGDFEKLHGLRAIARGLLVVMSSRSDVPEELRNDVRGMIYATSLLTLYAESSVCVARIEKASGSIPEVIKPYLVCGELSVPKDRDRNDYANALSKLMPYKYIFKQKVRESLEGKNLSRMEIVGSQMEVFTTPNLPYVVKVVKKGGINSYFKPAEFTRDVLPQVALARGKLGGLAANVFPVRNLKVTIDGEERVFESAVIQRKVVPLRDMITKLDWNELTPPEEIEAKKAKVQELIVKWWALQDEIHKRGVVDLDPKIADNYGYEEERGEVVIFDFSHITNDKERLRSDDTFFMSNLVNAYEYGNMEWLLSVGTVNSGSFALRCYHDMTHKNLRGDQAEGYPAMFGWDGDKPVIRGWPSPETAQKEEMFIPQNDPFKIDVVEIAQMERNIGRILSVGGRGNASGRLSAKTINSILSDLKSTMLWMYTTREREEMPKPATPSFVLATGKAPAVIGTGDGTREPLRLKDVPFYISWESMLDGERPVVPEISGDEDAELGKTREGADFVYNRKKIIPELKYIFEDLSSEESEAALVSAQRIARALGITPDMSAEDIVALNAARAVTRSLMVAAYSRPGTPDGIKRVIRGMAYAVGLLALMAEDSVTTARLEKALGAEGVQKFNRFFISPVDLSGNAELAERLAALPPYKEKSQSFVKDRLKGHVLGKVPGTGVQMDAYTDASLPFVIKVVKPRGVNSKGEPVDFERDVIPTVMLARTKFGGIGASVMAVENLTVNIDGEEKVFPNALIQTKVKLIEDKLRELDFSTDDPPADIVRKKEEIKNIMSGFFALQGEMHKRGVIDLDPKMIEKYGYDEVTGSVVVLDYSHITGDKDRLKTDKVFNRDFFLDTLGAVNRRDIQTQRYRANEYMVGCYREAADLFNAEANLIETSEGIVVKGWPADHPAVIEEAFIPMNDPLPLDETAYADMLEALRGAILGIEVPASDVSPQMLASLIGLAANNMGWFIRPGEVSGVKHPELARTAGEEGARRAEDLRQRIAQKKDTKVLFVCQMNWHRSFVMHMAASAIAKKEGIEGFSADSRGIYAGLAGLPSPELAEACKAGGVDPAMVNAFRSTAVAEQDLKASDYVIMTDPAVYEAIRARYPGYEDKLIFAVDIFVELKTRLNERLGGSSSNDGADKFLPDYEDGNTAFPAEAFYDLVSRALRKDLFGLPEVRSHETAPHVRGQRRQESEEVKREIGDILSAQDYPGGSVDKVPGELVLIAQELRTKFSGLKERIDFGDIDAAKKGLQEIVSLLAERGCKDVVRPNAVTRFLVNGVVEEDICDVIVRADDIPQAERKRVLEKMVAKISFTQAMYVSLKLLGLDVGVVYAPDHVLLSVRLESGKTLFIDPGMDEILEVDTSKYYDAAAGTGYMTIKPVYSETPPEEIPILPRLYRYVRFVGPAGLSVSMLNLRGDAYALLRRNPQAIDEYSKAIVLDARYPDARRGLGDIYARIEDDVKAAAEHTVADGLYPADELDRQKMRRVAEMSARPPAAEGTQRIRVARNDAVTRVEIEVPDEKEDLYAATGTAYRLRLEDDSALKGDATRVLMTSPSFGEWHPFREAWVSFEGLAGETPEKGVRCKLDGGKIDVTKALEKFKKKYPGISVKAVTIRIIGVEPLVEGELEVTRALPEPPVSVRPHTTFLMRFQEQHEYVKRAVEILAGSRRIDPEHPVKISVWSLGSSKGAEAASLAATVRGAVPEEALGGVRLDVKGVELDAKEVQEAKRLLEEGFGPEYAPVNNLGDDEKKKQVDSVNSALNAPIGPNTRLKDAISFEQGDITDDAVIERVISSSRGSDLSVIAVNEVLYQLSPEGRVKLVSALRNVPPGTVLLLSATRRVFRGKDGGSEHFGQYVDMLKDGFSSEEFDDGIYAFTKLPPVQLVVGVPARVYAGLKPEEVKKIGDISGARVVVIEALDAEGMLKELEEARFREGGKASALVDVGVEAKNVAGLVAGLAKDLKEKVFFLSNPELAELTPETIGKIEDLSGILRKISDGYLNSIRSLDVSSLGIYQLRVEGTYNKFRWSTAAKDERVDYTNAAIVTPNEHFLVHYADGSVVMDPKRKGLIVPAGLEISRRRGIMRVDRDTDLQHDKFMVMAPAGVVTSAEKEAFKKTLIDMWMLDGVVNPEDIVILDRKEKGYSTSELFGMVNAANAKALTINTGFRTIAGELNYDGSAAASDIVQVDLAPEASNNINQYEVLMNLLVAGDKAAILKLIPGLAQAEGRGMLFIYLPKANAVDLDTEVRNYDRYVREVLVRA